MDIGFLQFLHLLRHLAQFARRTTGFVCQVLTEPVAALRQRADEHSGILARGTHRRTRSQRTEAVNLGCLSDSRRRSNKGSAAKQRDEGATFHSITSSASAMSLSGIVKPSVFAVVRLMANSNLVDCITGRSAGFSPLRIRPT